MGTTRTRNPILALVGLGALAAYIMACRPSFSPDGSKVLFPCIGPEEDETSVALFDRRSQKLDLVLVIKKADGGVLSAQYAPDGKNAVVYCLIEDEKQEQCKGNLMVKVILLGTNETVRNFVVTLPEDLVLAVVFPPPIVGHYLFLGGGGQIARLDLNTGKTKTREIRGVIGLASQGGRVYYIAVGSDESCEVGRLGKRNLSRTPILRFRAEEYGDISPLAVLSQKGDRIAFAAKKGEAWSIHVFRGKEVERTVPIADANTGALGNLLWSPDGETIYAASRRKVEGEDVYQYGFTEIPLGGDAIRQTALFRSRDGGDQAIIVFQIALSPDGKTIAASSTCLEKVSEEDRGLYLVDLTTPERNVMKVRVPSAPRSAAAEEEKGE